MNEHCDSGQFIYDSIGHVPVYSIDSLPDLDDSQSLKENQKKYKRKKKNRKNHDERIFGLRPKDFLNAKKPINRKLLLISLHNDGHG